jgi:hypothetical protein
MEEKDQEKPVSNVLTMPTRTTPIVISGVVLDALMSGNHPIVRLSENKDLPVKISWWLARLVNKLNGEIKTYAAAREKLVLTYCDKDADGNPIKTDDTHVSITTGRNEFAVAGAELQSATITIGIDRIKIPIDSIPPSILSAFDMLAIEPFVEIVTT